MTLHVQEEDSVAERLHRAANRCVDSLIDLTISDRAGITWPSWRFGTDSRPAGVTGGQSDLYGGDAGIAWALGRLGPALDRPDAIVLADTARADLRHRLRGQDPDGGWLSGNASVLSALSDPPTLAELPAQTDLTAGAAGVLLAAARANADVATGRILVNELRRRARPGVWGCSWPEPTMSGDGARPLCGLSHGASGICWALVEAAARWPGLADEALSLAEQGFAWEACWSDPVQGGWPDLREGGHSFGAYWCHGAAGAGAVRLRILELMGAGSGSGLGTPWPKENVLAEAETALQSVGALVHDVTEMLGGRGLGDQHTGWNLPTGWTLCHGLGGGIGLLSYAADVLDAPSLLDTARSATCTFLEQAGDDPAHWPAGIRDTDGDVSLLNGVAGTAVLLAELAGALQPGTTVLLS